MEISNWLIFATVALASIVSPGPASLLAISNSLTFGFSRVAFSSLGNIIGLLLVSSFTMAGLGTLLKTAPLLFSILKLIGAGYLIFLGIRQWRSNTNIFVQASVPLAKAQRNNRQLFAQGVLLAVTNPKGILFFTALFPQFLTPGQPLALQFSILTGTFMAISFCSLMCYAFLARSTSNWFSTGRRAEWFNRASGGIFILLGIALLRLKLRQF